MRYKYILFDADETLLDFKAGERAAFEISCHDCGIVFTDELYRSYHLINDRHWKLLEKGLTTREKLKIQRFSDLFSEHDLGGADEAALFAGSYLDNLSRQSILYPDSVEIVKKLSQKYDLYIITNGITAVQHGRLNNSPVMPYMKGLFISDEMGTAKPEKAFFDIVMEKVGSRCADDYIVIGDSPTSDIAGAVCAGMDSVLISWGREYGDVGQTYTVNEPIDILNILIRC